MARIISEKKKAESGDGKQGRKEHQKLKSYIVTQYLLKNTDEDHPASAKDIIDYLADFGIYAERRSIYRDIQEINEVMYALENDCKLEYAAEAIAADECRLLKSSPTVVGKVCPTAVWALTENLRKNAFTYWKKLALQSTRQTRMNCQRACWSAT